MVWPRGLTEHFWTWLLSLYSTRVIGIYIYWQDSTQSSPFSLLYGREARLPTTLTQPEERRDLITDEGYLAEIKGRMKKSWELTARQAITKAQQRQKDQYDQNAEDLPFSKGDTIYFMPSRLSGKTRKLERPNDRPYEIVNAYTKVWKKGWRNNWVIRVGIVWEHALWQSRAFRHLPNHGVKDFDHVWSTWSLCRGWQIILEGGDIALRNQLTIPIKS